MGEYSGGGGGGGGDGGGGGHHLRGDGGVGSKNIFWGEDGVGGRPKIFISAFSITAYYTICAELFECTL